MTIFITQGRYTREALAGLAARPEDRATEVSKLFEAAGGRLISLYVTFGEYDFLVIGEGDDHRKLLGALVAAGMGGGVTDLRTMIALTSAEAVDGFATAGEIAKGFRSAGQSAAG